MTDATLPALSSPPPDPVPSLSVMDCTAQEEALQPTSSTTDSSQSGPGVPFCDLDPQLLKHCNSDMLESCEGVKLKPISYSNDRGGSTSGVEDDVAFNLSNQKLLGEIPPLKTSPPSQVNLCSNKAFSAKIPAGETVEAQPNMCSSVEANHLQMPVLPKLDASSNSSVVDVDLLDKLMSPTEPLPVSVETKEDPLSIDSSASIKSSNSLSCDEASSKDSLLTSTESKSMGSPPDVDLSTSTEGKELYEASKGERTGPECSKTNVSLLSSGDCVKPFVIAQDETDSGCPSDSDGLVLHNSAEEINTEGNAAGICAPSDSLASVPLSDVDVISPSNPAMSSNSLNLGTFASASDGSHKCDTSEKKVEGRLSSSSVVMAEISKNVSKKTEGVEPAQNERTNFSGLTNLKVSSASCSSGGGSLRADNLSCIKESPESSKEKSLESKMKETEPSCQAQSSLHSDASGTPIEGNEISTAASNFELAIMSKSSINEDKINDLKTKLMPQSDIDLGSTKVENVHVTDAGSTENACGDRISNDSEEPISTDHSECDSAAHALNKGLAEDNIPLDEVIEAAQPESFEADVVQCEVKTAESDSIERNPSNVENCTLGSTGESLQNICSDKPVECKNSRASCNTELDQLPSSLDPDESIGVSTSSDVSERSFLANSKRIDCFDDSLSTGKCISTVMPSTEESSVKKEFGYAQRLDAGPAVEPGNDTHEVSLESKSFISTDASGKMFEISKPAGDIESECDVDTSTTENKESRSKFEDCYTTDTAVSVISDETSGQPLKIEHPESLKLECSSQDATDVNVHQELETPRKSGVSSTDPSEATAASKEKDIEEKVRMGCATSDHLSSKQSVDGGKIFPSLDESSEAGNVVLQTVVGGVLQPLDMAALEARKTEEEDTDNRKLFAGVDEELAGAGTALSHNTAMHVLENNAGETDGIGGLVINSVMGAFGEGGDEYADGESATEVDPSNKELADISLPYHAMNKDINTQPPECEDMPRSKRPRLENVEVEVRRPVVLKVKPVKGKSESFWDSPKLRTALAEKGTVLLRLCTTEPTEEFDTPADFVGVMLECCEEMGYSGHLADKHSETVVYSAGVDGGYHPGVYNPYGYLARTPTGGDDDFVETEEVEECMDYDGASQTLDWQGKKVPSAFGARQSMPPPHLPHGGYYIPPPHGISPVSPPFMRGKRKPGMRGRPPVHVRGVYHMVAPAPTPAAIAAAPGAAAQRAAATSATVAPSYPPHHYYSLPPPYASPASHPPVGASPSPSALTPSKSTKGSSVSAKSADTKTSSIIFRPPTPPQVTDTPKSAVLAAGSLRRCSSLLSVRRPAPGSILSQQMKLLYKEESSDDHNARASSSVRSKPAGSKISGSSKKSPSKKQKIPCDFCSSKFRKRTALLAHIKHKHRLMKKCPICNVGVRVKGKYNMKFHILKNHKEINNFACGDCGAVFKLQHHLKNHIRLGCDPPDTEEQSSAASADPEMSLTEADILVPSTAEIAQGDVQNSDRELELLGSEAPTDESLSRPSERKNSGKSGFDDRPDVTSDASTVHGPANAPAKRKRSRSRLSESSSDVEDRKKDKALIAKVDVIISKPSRKRQKVDSANDFVAEQEASGQSEEAKLEIDKSQNESPLSKLSPASKPTVDKCDRNYPDRPKNKFKLNPTIGLGDSETDKAESSEGENTTTGVKPKSTKILKKKGKKPKLKSTGHTESSDESDHEGNSVSTEVRGKGTKKSPGKNSASSKGQRDSSRERKSQCPKVPLSEPDNQSRNKKSSTRLRNSDLSGMGSGESDADIHRPHLRGNPSSKLPVHRHSSDSCKTGSGSECDKSDRKEISMSTAKSLRSKMSSPTRPSRRVRVEEEIIPKSIKAQTILKRLKIDNGRSSRSNSEAGSSSDSEVEEEKRFFCKLCDAGFSHAFKLRHHRREIHSGSGGAGAGGAVSLAPSTPKESNKLDNEHSIKLNCSQCGKHCRNAYQLRLHMLTHSANGNQTKIVKKPLGRPPKDRTKTLQNTSEEQQAPRQEETRAEDKCDSPENSSVPSAEDPSSSVSPSVRSSSSLNQLPSYIIKKARVFICTKCSLTFKREKSVTYHMKKIHETLYPFKACPHCGRVFRSCGPYHKHMKLHNIRHCPVEGCKARYRAFRKMKQHQKSSHEDYPHRCTSCEQLYKLQHELDEHTKVAHVKHEPEDEDEEDDASEGEQQLEDAGETNEQEQESSKEEEKDSEENSKFNVVEKLDVENLPNKRRTRTELSYKEEEEEDLLLVKKKRPLPMINKSPFKRKIGFARSPFKASSISHSRSKSKRINEVEKLKKTDFDIFKRNEELDRSSRRKTIEEPVPVIVKPKKVVKKKKISMSWTAALKARIKAEALAAASKKPLKVNRPKTPKSSPTVKTTKTSSATKSQKSPASAKAPGGVKSPKSPQSVKPPKSPAVAAATEHVKVPPSPSEIIANENLAALVVRRVAETLASQEVADLKVPSVAESYTPTTPSPASSVPPPPPTPPPTAPTPPIPHPQHFGPYSAPYPFPHYYGYPHPPPPMYHPHSHPYPPYPAPPPNFHHPGYHPPYAGSEDSCSSVDTHQDNSSNSTDRPDSPNKVLRFDNF